MSYPNLNKNYITRGISKAFFAVLVTLGCLYPDTLSATHIVGGDLSYRALGGDAYELTLRIRRDCENAAEEADFDDPAIIGIFDKEGNWLFNYGFGGQFLLDFQGATVIEDELASECLLAQGELCVEEAIYTDTIWIPIQDEGYIFAYQRCCRNILLNNIVDPLNTGVIYKTCIEPESMDGGNKSAQFSQHTPLYVCINEPWVFDHSATDEDGDDLVYSLYTPFQSGTADDPIPTPPFGNPLDREVEWLSPTYSETNMLGGSSPLTIDPNTGILTATPEITGVFLIGVKVEEFRNGELINTVYRDMEIDIRACGDIPTASFEVETYNCDGFDVTFDNTSEGANFYNWIFDFPEGTITSNLEEPGTITFPGPGAYTVLLQAFADDSCRAEAVQVIFVNDFDAVPDFSSEVESCEEEIVITLNDESTGDIESYEWLVETADSTISGEGDPFTFVLEESALATVTLFVYDSIGCRQSITKEIQYNRLNLEFNIENEGDTLRACLDEPTQLLLNGNPDWDYTWSPEDGLDDPNSHNPLATPQENTTYSVTVTDGLCEVTGSVDVFVVIEEGSIEAVIESIDCEGNAVLTSTNSEGADVEWSDEADFSNIIGNTETISVTVDEIEDFYVRIVDGVFECIDVIDTITVENPDVDPDINIDLDNSGTVGGGSGDSEDDRAIVCRGETLTLVLEGDLSGEDLTIVWSPEECILEGQGTTSVIIDTDNPECTDFSVSVVNEFDCSGETEFFIEIDTTPSIAGDFDYLVCGDGDVDFTVDNPSEVDVMWDFGDGNMSMEQNPSHEYEESGTYTVIVSSKGLCVGSDTLTVDVLVVDDISPNGTSEVVNCSADNIILNEGGDPDLDYMWSPAEKFDDPTAPTQEISPDSTCLVTVVITDPNNPFCELLDTVNIIVPERIDLELTTEQPINNCEPEEEILEVTTNITEGVTIEWFDEDGNSIGTGNSVNVTPADTTCYTAVATDSLGCTEEVEVCVNVVGPMETRITVFDDPNDQGPDDAFCPDEEGMIVIEDIDDDQDFTYMWGPDECIEDGTENTDMPIISSPTTKTYTVTITDPVSGCEVIREVTIEISDPSCDIEADMDTVFIGNGGTTLNSLCGSDNITDYEWTDENGNVIGTGETVDVDPMETTVYTLTTTDENGCSSTTMITITVIPAMCNESDIFVPNAFTPDGDGRNDELIVRSVFVDEFYFIIYNRWGEQVFESRDINVHWDGTFEGELARPDVYGWYLEATCFGGLTYQAQGNVSVLR